MKYKCTNVDCPKFDQEVTVSKVKMIYDKFLDKMVPKDPILCLHCKQDLEYVREPGPITVHFNQFESMTPQDKRAMIHKRSVDHFKKTDKGDLANYKKQITDDLRRKAEGRMS